MRYCVFLIFLFGFSHSAWAQTDESRIGDFDIRPSLPRDNDLGIEIPDIRDSLGRGLPKLDPLPPLTPPSQAPSGDGERFILKQVIIENAELYSEEQLHQVYRFFLNKSVDFDTLNQIARRIESFYREQGWFATQVVIPRQSIVDGIVRYRVFEGFINKVVIEGDSFLEDLIDDILAPLITDKPATTAEVEFYLRRLRNIVPAQMDFVPQPASEDVPGGTNLVVKILGHDFVSGTLSIQNTANESVGPWTASLSTNVNLARVNLSLYLANSFLDTKESFTIRGSYEYKINYEGMRAGMHIGGNRTRPDTPNPIDDKGVNLGFFFHMPFYTSPSLNLEGRAQFDFSRRLTVSVSNNAITTQGDTNSVMLSLSGNYRSLWNNYVSTNLRLRQGLTEGGPDSGGGDLAQRRSSSILADFLYVQSFLPQNGWIPGQTLSFSAQGQYGLDPLTSSQQIAFGGDGVGRGFTSGRISGDSGYGATAELRLIWSHLGVFSQAEPTNVKSAFQEVVLYSFFDYGETYYKNNKSRGIDNESSRFLYSTGLGIRLRILNLFYTDFTWARTLNAPYGKGVVNSNIIIGGVRQDQSDSSDKNKDDFLFRLYHLF